MSRTQGDPEEGGRSMEYVLLGRTGVRVSPLCLGTMNFGLRTPASEAERILNRAREAGINFIDTADVYGAGDNRTSASGVGESERIIGAWLARSGLRDRLVLATKAFFPTDPSDPNAGGASRRHILRACEESLVRLGTDRIDLFQLHWPSAEVPLDETLRALEDLVRAGKVLYVGTSNFDPWKIVEALWIASDLRLHRVVSEQAPYSMVCRAAERYLLPMANRHHVAVLAWSPLWGGFLTGKYRAGEPFPDGSRFTMDLPLWAIWKNRMEPAAFDLLGHLDAIAVRHGRSVSQIALGWTLRRPGITALVIGPRTVEQLEDNLAALSVELDESDLSIIDCHAPPGRALVRPLPA